MAKAWQTGDIITANELNRVEADIAGKVSTETDPVWLAQRDGVFTDISDLEEWISWETAHKGNTSNLAISNNEVDISAYLGTLSMSKFGKAPISYVTNGSKFLASPTGKSYAFTLNLRLSGELSGSPTSTTIFKLVVKRASDGSVISSKSFAKDTVAPTTFVLEDTLNFITRVYGDSDPFVTGGFKLYLQRVAGNQTLTLSGAQQLFFVK